MNCILCFRFNYYCDMEKEEDEWENDRLERHEQELREYLESQKHEREQYNESMAEIYISMAKILNA